jgi:sugar phosphate isomerase/epimerase
MRVALSTSACPRSLSPTAALARWRALAGDEVSALAVDERWPSEQQTELLRLTTSSGARCCELAHPTFSARTRPAASPASSDREERRAAGRQLVDTVQRAADREVLRVLLRPARISLTPEIARLRWLYALDRQLPLDDLAAQRSARIAPALDGLRAALDPALEAAARLGVRLALVGPAPWPHEVPRSAEVQLLREEFRGAPLGCCLRVDWAWAAAALGTADPLAAPEALHLADAAGLATRLPLGSGQLDAEHVAAALRDAAECVLTLRSDVERDEVRRSMQWIERALSMRV